jgi:hypothetical protein
LLGNSFAHTEELLITAPLVFSAEQKALEQEHSRLHFRIAEVAGIKTQLVFKPPHLARASHERGEAAAMLAATCDAERSRPNLYSIPYSQMARHLISAGESPQYAGINQLSGLTLGLINRFYYKIPSAEDLQELDITIHGSSGYQNNLKMLARGRVDVILAPASVMEGLNANSGAPLALKYAKEPFSVHSLCYTVSDSDKGKLLINKLNKAIRSLHASGELASFMSPPFEVPSIEQIRLKSGKMTAPRA